MVEEAVLEQTLIFGDAHCVPGPVLSAGCAAANHLHQVPALVARTWCTHALPTELVGSSVNFSATSGGFAVSFERPRQQPRLPSGPRHQRDVRRAPRRHQRARSPSGKEGSKPACISSHCASRIYIFFVYERYGGEGRRTWAPESLRTTQGV